MVEGFGEGLICGSVGRGWALRAWGLPSIPRQLLSLLSRVGVLFRHLMHIVAPACFAARILDLLQRAHAPSGALSVRDMATCMNHARICAIGILVEIAASMGHPLLTAISRASMKIPHEVPSVCCTDSHTALVLGGSTLGG